MEKAEHLYHYTKYSSFVDIIKTNEFLFSNFINANDYKEKAVRHEDKIRRYRYVSFTYNQELELYSYTNSPMWYFYADKGSGVCICFDKAKLLKEVKIIKRGFVNYRDGVTHIDAQTIDEYLMEKRKVWKYEDEYRILVDAEHKSISNILEHITAVYVGPEVSEKGINFICQKLPESISVFQIYVDKTDGRYNSIDYRNKLSLKTRIE